MIRGRRPDLDDDVADVGRPPEPPPMPRVWFGELVNALRDGDRQGESRALAELAGLGINVTIGPRWRQVKS